MSGWSPLGALVGLVAGVGLAVAVLAAPALRRPGLDDRLAPYLRDASPPGLLDALLDRPGGTVPGARWRALEQLLGPSFTAAGRWAELVTGGPATVHRRLDQLGRNGSVERFRAEQVVCGLVGALLGAAAGLLATSGRGGSAVPVLALLVIGGLLGVLGRDQLLTRQVRRRQERMLAEFPAVAELLALSVGAGEGAGGALDRVARTCRGDLADELSRVVGDTRAGVPLGEALDALAARTTLAPLARFVDGMVVALERGTPLADVVRAQAQDVRELTRRRLVESGGRREIAMTIPVVFLVLPVTVLFAVYPGLALLDLAG